MKRKTIRSYVVSILMCSLLTALVPFTAFGETKNNTWYRCTIDAERTDFENGKYWIQKVTYENGATTTINPVDRFTFLMINNQFIPNVNIKNENGHTLVPIRLITEELGGKAGWDAKKKTAAIDYQNKNIILQAGDKHAVINGKNVVLPIAAQIVDNSLYVPLRAVAEAFQIEISYNLGLMPFENPLISLDGRAKRVTKEEALKVASDAMKQAYTSFSKNPAYADGSDSSTKALAEIKQKIDQLAYKDESAGYWILIGPYDILVDKATGALFFKYGKKGTSVSGSYSEGITPVNVNDPEVFARDFFLG
ncbi:stalk domain-containing protein [Brevibacillus ruminantium]|uniref:Stalk domain-containing protein n=1 Tax=Brevibacillus ruminantium TaxID=2950604 RepID=A0ABY4WCK6_9BACL|nr:stalk domain-containing protein [Brevibacillus ruminantium]USG64925.1 stalk domain-containing protein [Brevibacillus ruminantium]